MPTALSPARHYLSSLQTALVERSASKPEPVTPLLVDRVLAVLRRRSSTGEPATMESLRAAIREVERDILTPLENPFRQLLLRDLQQRLHLAAARAQQRNGWTVHLGTLATGELHAESHLFRASSEYLIVLDSGIFPLVHAVCQSIALAISYDDGRAVFSALNPNSENDGWTASAIMYRAILNYVMAPTYRHDSEGWAELIVIRRSPAHPLAPGILAHPISSFSHQLAAAVEFFIVAHEYAHLLEADDEKGAALAASTPCSVDDTWAAYRTEHHADLVACNLAAVAMSNTSMAFFAFTIFFAMGNIIERGRMMLYHGKDLPRYVPQGPEDLSDFPPRHPPAYLRAGHLREAAKQRCLADGVEPTLLQEVLQDCAVIDNFFGQTWHALSERLLVEHHGEVGLQSIISRLERPNER